MLVECRPSSLNKWIVDWLRYERVFCVITGRNVIAGVYKHREFNTYADASGFHSGLVKRGIKSQLRSKFK